MKKILLISAVLVFLLATERANSQVSQGETMDKVVAVVGNEIILLSDIRGQLAMMASQNPNIKPDDPVVYKQILDAIINEKLLITKAIEDSIEVTDDQIEARWQAFLQTLLQQFGSEERIEQVYKKTLTRLKFELRDDIRNKMLSSNLVQKIISDINVTPKEVEEFFVSYKDSLPRVPKMVEVYHITKLIKPETDEKQRVFNLARSIRDSILRGGDFAKFAERYSGDAGTATNGGELGWINKGKFFPEFEAAAFALQVNEISMPTETPFGFHLIQVLDKRKDAIQTRHILFKIEQKSSDKDKAIQFLDSLKNLINKGEKFEDLAKIHSDDKDTKGFGGFIGKLPLSEFPSNIRTEIENLKDGEVSAPLSYSLEPTKPGFRLIYKKATIGEHYPNMIDDADYLKESALEMKKMRVYNDYIEQLRKELYWELKD